MEVVSHVYFDYAVTFCILVNGAIVGVQTDWMARALEDSPPFPFQVMEIVFGIIFTLELALRLFAYRCMFFFMPGKGWNIFDFTVVSLQWIEMVLELMAAGLGVDFSLLRILRLIRVIRLARALRLIGELRTIVSSIAGSMKSLFWTGVLLFMVVYVLGVGFTQVVLSRRIKFKKDGEETPEELFKFWGDLVSACFSLFESITGGLDWDDAARPLIIYVGAEWGVVFAFFIMFTVFAMLNVVTGVFIESVMKNASIENELRTASHVASLFKSLDHDEEGEISWEDFSKALETKEMKDFFKAIDVDIENARSLFDLLDLDESGFVNGDEFVDGCLRIWAPTKGLDLRMIRRDLNKLSRLLEYDSRPGKSPRLLSQMTTNTLHTELELPMQRQPSNSTPRTTATRQQTRGSLATDSNDASEEENRRLVSISFADDV
jgi:voltage-gated sodium channel